jgi:hypothetical protein
MFKAMYMAEQARQAAHAGARELYYRITKRHRS